MRVFSYFYFFFLQILTLTMSSKEDTSNTMMLSCASCGKTEGDGIQLRTCTACKSVRYCGVICQRNHRPKHKKACKKRAAELRDEILFKQPESSHYGDCPICLLPLPLVPDGSVHHDCCSKLVCRGCLYAYIERVKQERREPTCPFCRDVTGKSDVKQKMIKRVQANDPSATCQMGMRLDKEGKYAEAVAYYSKAAELGDANAHFNLSLMYQKGQGVEKDEKKCLYHTEEATIKGQLDARFGLAQHDCLNGRETRAVKHLIIAANLGHDKSMKALKDCYKNGLVSKEDFAGALRAHKAAVDAMKSPEREAAMIIMSSHR